MERTVRQIANNRSVRTEPIRYIVVHDTGNEAAGATAEAHYTFFHTANRNSSADIFADDRSVWQVNDYHKYYTWHCGDGCGIYGITNRNSVGVELCVNAGGDYAKAMRNMAEVVRELMAELEIPAERVVRHYDASRKLCPKSMSKQGWKMWDEFKEMLKGEMDMTQYEELKAEITKLQTPMIYNYIDENMPGWAREAVTWAVESGVIQGDGVGLALNDDKLWFLTVLYRTKNL